MEKAQVIRPTRNRWLQAGREVIRHAGDRSNPNGLRMALACTKNQALAWASKGGLWHKPRHSPRFAHFLVRLSSTGNSSHESSPAPPSALKTSVSPVNRLCFTT